MGGMQVLTGADQLWVNILDLSAYGMDWSASLCNPLLPMRFQASAAV